MARRIRICFLIPSLVAHGAERQLCELARALDKRRFEVHIITFYRREDWIGADLTPELVGQPGIHLHSLGKRPGRLVDLSALARLLRLVWELEPTIVHGYMDGNLPALLVGGLLRARVVWGIRNSGAPAEGGGALRFLAARLSGLADLILYNSETGRSRYQAWGYRPPVDQVIPNGFDLNRFRPDPQAGLRQRAAWGVPPEAPLVGIVGRLSPVKDHETFLRTAARMAGADPATRFVIVGEGPPARTQALKTLAGSLLPADRLTWAGHCEDMGAVYNSLSLLLLTSTQEGFPNVLGEALACGVPCVSTRAGDAERIVGDGRRICEPGNDRALAAAALVTLSAPRSPDLRARIEHEFGASALARRTAQAMESMGSGLHEGVQ